MYRDGNYSFARTATLPSYYMIFREVNAFHTVTRIRH